MKAISLWEPWASLMRTTAKKIETRHWATVYRGPLLICAAKGGVLKMEVISMLSRWPFQGGLAPLVGKPLDLTGSSWPGVNIEHLNFGKAVAIVELVDCRPTGQMTLDEIGTDMPFGNYKPGRFAWITKMIRNDFEPFPVKGHQGFFSVDDELIEQHLPNVVKEIGPGVYHHTNFDEGGLSESGRYSDDELG